MGVNIFAEGNFWGDLWDNIVKFFTVLLPDFFIDYEANWIWFIVIGAGLLILIALIILLVRGKKRKKAKKTAKAVESIKAVEKADEQAELDRARREREEGVRAEQDTLFEQRIAAEERSTVLGREGEERKLQEEFARQTKEGDLSSEPAVDTFAQNRADEISRMTAAFYSAQSTGEPGTAPAEGAGAPAAESEAKGETAGAEKPKTTAKKPAAKSGTAKSGTAKSGASRSASSKSAQTAAKPAEDEKPPSDAVKYSIVYDRTSHDWVVRKSGADRAIRRLRTKAEALEYAEQLSARQGLALQVHKKDGKFQKQ